MTELTLDNYYLDMSIFQTKEDFIEFVRLLQKDIIANHENWQNWRLSGYLNSISRFCAARAGFRVGDPFEKDDVFLDDVRNAGGN